MKTPALRTNFQLQIDSAIEKQNKFYKKMTN